MPNVNPNSFFSPLSLVVARKLHRSVTLFSFCNLRAPHNIPVQALYVPWQLCCREESTATTTELQHSMNFPGPIGTKRRRMRSGGNVSTMSSYSSIPETVGNISEEKTTQTSKCKGATTIPIFLKSKFDSSRRRQEEANFDLFDLGLLYRGSPRAPPST
jgi:hypothetical protein